MKYLLDWRLLMSGKLESVFVMLYNTRDGHFTLHCSVNQFELRTGVVIQMEVRAYEGDYTHQAVALHYGTNLVAWHCQRQSLHGCPVNCKQHSLRQYG